MTAVLRGSKASGYRTSTPLECPHCSKSVTVAGTASIDKQGPHLLLWAVETRLTDYDDATLAAICAPEPASVQQTGIALPQAPGRGEFRDNPVPTFKGERP